MQWNQDQKGISGGLKVSISSSVVYLYSKAWDNEVGPSPDCESKHSKSACWGGGMNTGVLFWVITECNSPALAFSYWSV